MQSVTISFSIANFIEDIDEDIINNLAIPFPEVSLSKLEIPKHSGKFTIRSAAFEWQIVSNLANLLSMVSFLWLVYDKIIKPKKTKKSNAGIVFKIENKRIINNFWIGNEINSKEELSIEMKKVLKQLRVDSRIKKSLVRKKRL